MATGHGQMGISCLCKTYGRTSLLEEAIQSFLLQDYPGPKELIVLNDLDLQDLRFSHPNVRVINVQERFPTLGDKHNALAELARYDLLAPWDDDDIYLPSRLSTSVARLRHGFFKPKTALFWLRGQITGFDANTFHAQACFEKTVWRAVGGYPSMDVGEDVAFEKRLRALYPIDAFELPQSDAFYIYRWFGETHLSDQNRMMRDVDPYQSFDQDIRAKIERGEEPSGVIDLKPYWGENYIAEARDHIMGLTGLPQTMDLN